MVSMEPADRPLAAVRPAWRNSGPVRRDQVYEEANRDLNG